MRKVLRWNQNWEFYKGEDLEAAVWESVELPHTYNALDGQDGGGDYYQGPAYYRKKGKIEKKYPAVYIRFGAVSKKADVWCNGTFVGSHSGGFSAFTFDLTPYLTEGDNEILVKADNSIDLPIYPFSADFTFFGGIYRDVELILFEGGVHFDVTSFGTDAVFVTPGKDGQVGIKAAVTGECRVSAEIADAEGQVVACAEEEVCGKTADCGEEDCGVESAVSGSVRWADINVTVPAPRLWSGRQDPYLYTLKLSVDGQDEIEVPFGFRSYEVTMEEGFFLNGKSYPLHGVCRHQDREDKGWAISERDQDEDMELICEIGANTVRLAHYQHAKYFYDLCDRAGMVVWAEIPFISVHDSRPESDENLRQQLTELICQNYNHPSICFWGIANEIGIGGESERQYEILAELHGMAKKMDPGRLTVVANVGMTRPESPLCHTTDLVTYNEYMGWYEGKPEDHGSFCDGMHGALPEIPLGISEYGADSVLAYHSETPKCKDYTEEYQALIHEKAEGAFAERPYLWATWLWNMFDFAADARDEGGCKGRNNKGLVTFDRKIKKQTFFYYKARWSKEPFVYICGERFTVRAQEEITIKVYSNLESVSLSVNGGEPVSKKGSGVFEFPVRLEEGANEITARGEDGSTDTLTLQKTDKLPEEYTLKITKTMSDNVTQWFANIAADVVKDIVVKEGYLSVYDPLEEVYRYPEGYEAVCELVRTPLAIDHPEMAARMSTGGAMSFHSIWNHINRMLPDEVYYLLNERLNKIKKNDADEP